MNLKSQSFTGTLSLWTLGFLAVFLPAVLFRESLTEDLKKWVPEYKSLVPSYWHSISSVPEEKNGGASETNSEIEKEERDFEPPPFLKNVSGLNPFFKRLAMLESGRIDRLRVMHFGDSTMGDEKVASKLRKDLQQEFGAAGRGWVYLHHDDYWVTLDQAKSSGSSFELLTVPFEHFNHDEPKWLPRVGYSGMTYLAHSYHGEAVVENLSEDPWLEVALLLRPAEGQLGKTQKVSIRMGDTMSEHSISLRNQCNLKTLPLNGARDIGLRFSPVNPGGTSAYIDAVHMRSGRGVEYNSYIHKGRHMAWLTAIPDDNFECGFRALPADLIVMQFGINESGSLNWRAEGFTEEAYLRQMRELFSRYKKVMPDAAVMIIGSYERYKPEGDGFVYYPEHDRVRALQRQIANEFGFAFFDSYAYFGGRGQLKRMIAEGLGAWDYSHLTFAGGDYLGEGILNELLPAFDKFTGRPVRKTNAVVPTEKAASIEAENASPILFHSMNYLAFFLMVLLLAGISLRWPFIRLFILVGASWFFYASWKWWALPLMLSSTVVDYFMARLVYSVRGKNKRGTFYLVFSLCWGLGLLFFFKYHNFFADSLNSFALPFLPQIPLLQVILPAGISFYTFQSLSYTIDVWRGKQIPERSFWRFALFVSFFTQLVAGPIVKAGKFLPRINQSIRHFKPKGRHARMALFLVLSGLFKKILGDYVALHHVDRVFNQPEIYTSAEMLVAIYGFAAQIYLDFSGYTDMALGSAMALGFHLTRNFKSPYLSVSISDFWRRWHISLGSWIRDYVYISLGGNRKRLYVNLLITMFLAGLWHGAGTNFILWGLWHGVIMMIERALGTHQWERGKLAPFSRAMMTLLTFHLVLIGWVVFRCHDMQTFYGVYDSLLAGIWASPNLTTGITLAIILPLLWQWLPEIPRYRLYAGIRMMPAPVFGAVAAILIFIITRLQTTGLSSFIYFQF